MDKTLAAMLSAAVMGVGVTMTFSGWLAYLAGAAYAGEAIGLVGLAFMVAPHLIYHGQGQVEQRGRHGV